jgi:hypothetical protein
MRPSPTPNDDNDQNDITTFIFVMESLARAVLGKNEGDRINKCHDQVSKKIYTIQ